MSFGPIVGDNYKIWMSITEINDSKELLGQNSEKLSLSYPQFYICSPEEEAKRWPFESREVVGRGIKT